MVGEEVRECVVAEEEEEVVEKREDRFNGSGNPEGERTREEAAVEREEVESVARVEGEPANDIPWNDERFESMLDDRRGDDLVDDDPSSFDKGGVEDRPSPPRSFHPFDPPEDLLGVPPTPGPGPATTTLDSLPYSSATFAAPFPSARFGLVGGIHFSLPLSLFLLCASSPSSSRRSCAAAAAPPSPPGDEPTGSFPNRHPCNFHSAACAVLITPLGTNLRYLYIPARDDTSLETHGARRCSDP